MIHDEAIPKEAHVYPVHSGHKLLHFGAYQKVLREISAITKLDVAHENTCYVQLIEQYAEFVQLLPHPLTGEKESLLSRSVKRAFVMLREFARHQKERHGADYATSETGARLLYAVFSAGLLFEVGNICIDRRIMLCDAQGRYRAQWQYFDKPMMHYGQYYKVRFGQGMDKKLVPEITHILAKQIMPSLGFAWLSEDQVILIQWFTALNQRDEFFGVYKIELEIDKCIEDDPLELEDIPSEVFVPEETLVAEKYWEWLREKIRNSDASIGSPDGAIQVVDGDILLDHAKLSTEFGRVFSRYRDAVVLSTQFNHLGICQLDGQDYKFFQYYSLPHSSTAKAGIAGAGLYSSRALGQDSSANALFSQAQKQGAHADHTTKQFVKINNSSARQYFSNLESLPQNDYLVPVEKPNAVSLHQRLESSYSIIDILKNTYGR